MLPWGHAAVGYLLYSGAERARGTRATAPSTAAVLVGSQLPDLIDKPLAWTVPLLPNGRSLAHSLVSGSLIVLVAVGLLAAVGLARLGWPLAVGAVSHSLGDALHPLLTGDWPSLAFLAWPVLPPVEYDATESILAHLLGFDRWRRGSSSRRDSFSPLSSRGGGTVGPDWRWFAGSWVAGPACPSGEPLGWQRSTSREKLLVNSEIEVDEFFPIYQ